MRRLFWLGLGAAAGVYAMRRLSAAAKAYSPAGVAGGLAGGLSDLGEGLREMSQVVREGMAEREAELRVALGIDAGVTSPEAAQRLIEDPTGPRAASGSAAHRAP
jgi:Family of unknown function (DUF6167)